MLGSAGNATRHWVEFEFELDYAAVAPASVEPEASQQRSCGPVLPQRGCGEQREAVRAGMLHHASGERGADSQALQLVGDFGSDLRDPSSIGYMHVAGHANDRAVALIDRSEPLVVEAIDIGQVREFLRRQCVLWR